MKVAMASAASSSAAIVRGPNNGECGSEDRNPQRRDQDGSRDATAAPRVIVNRADQDDNIRGHQRREPDRMRRKEARRPITTTCTMTIAKDTSQASKGSRR